MTRYLGVVHHQGRTFDWTPRHDPESRNYGVRRLVEVPPTRAVWWTAGQVTNQLAEGACVGHGITQEFLSSPVRGKLPVVGRERAANDLAMSVYRRAKEIDPWPGIDYDGTAVNAGMKVGRERGWWTSYHWAFGIEDVKRALLLGPVVLGIEWREGMYETRGSYAELVPDGDVVGGHCILATGWSPGYGNLGETIRLRNSWGAEFGKAGNCYIRVANLAKLLDAEGEAAVPTGRAYGLAA